jgi:hypothetical protein
MRNDFDLLLSRAVVWEEERVPVSLKIRQTFPWLGFLANLAGWLASVFALMSSWSSQSAGVVLLFGALFFFESFVFGSAIILYFSTNNLTSAKRWELGALWGVNLVGTANTIALAIIGAVILITIIVAIIVGVFLTFAILAGLASASNNS